MFSRYLNNIIDKIVQTGGLFLLGPRQVGKSTLIENFLKTDPKPNLQFRLQESRIFEEIAKRPTAVLDSVEALLPKGPLNLFIDEIQMVPELLGDCQSLIDRHKNVLKIFLTGSSARKLRKSGANLLPGRVLFKHLHPLILPEFSKSAEQYIVPLNIRESKTTASFSLEEILIHGTLPGILGLDAKTRPEMLRSYVTAYLQEEIRSEALTRKIGPFAKFLEIAALESGSAPNISNMSQETGIPASTIATYFDILEDTLIIHKIPPFGSPGRKRTLTTPRYLFFDTGVRNAAAGLPLARGMLKTQGGTLFEQWVILEIIRRIDYLHAGEWKYSFWRTNYGAEVDLVIETHDRLIPIEIKWAETPQENHIRHLKSFMKEYGVRQGFLIGRFARAQKMRDGILAIPWHNI